MWLEMYLNERLVDTVMVSMADFRFHQKRLKTMQGELLQKHKGVVGKSSQQPSFILSGVSSGMNTFRPLGT